MKKLKLRRKRTAAVSLIACINCEKLTVELTPHSSLMQKNIFQIKNVIPTPNLVVKIHKFDQEFYIKLCKMGS